IGYTLSWSWREFPDINGGAMFHPRYDRRHDVSVVLIADISKRLSLTAAWVYGTGQAISLPISWFLQVDPVEGANTNIIPVYTERNGFRMPAYHRGDLGLVYRFFPKWGESDLTLSIYNAYNRRNPYFIYYDLQQEEQFGIEVVTGFSARQVALFPIIPSLTWNFKF
ncbi:MAG: TonB-dependent receptor, partial [Bacteroidota bacterium]